MGIQIHTTICYTQLEFIRHLAVHFVLNRLWMHHHHDSISDTLISLNWLSLRLRRKNARLTLLHKLFHHYQIIPQSYLPSQAPFNTRSNHCHTLYWVLLINSK